MFPCHSRCAANTFGNITRINNALDELPKRLTNIQSQLENLYKQQEAAKYELALPFAQEEELAAKEARLALLNADLNIDGDGGFDVINDRAMTPLPPRFSAAFTHKATRTRIATK